MGTIPYEIAIKQLCVSSLNERILIHVGIASDDAKLLQQKLHKLCMLPDVQKYLTNLQGYRWSDDPLNMTRFLYVLRCFCISHSRLRGIHVSRHAQFLYKQCLENYFGHFPSADAIAVCMNNHKRRLPLLIRLLIANVR